MDGSPQVMWNERDDLTVACSATQAGSARQNGPIAPPLQAEGGPLNEAMTTSDNDMDPSAASPSPPYVRQCPDLTALEPTLHAKDGADIDIDTAKSMHGHM